MNLFHVTVAALVGTMAVFGVAIATAQSGRIQSWNDLLKPYEAKTAPPAPIDAPIPTTTLAHPQQLPNDPAFRAKVAAAEKAAGYTTTPPATGGNTSLLDGCVISAIGRLPKADGLRVTKSSYEFRHSIAHPLPMQFWTVSIAVNLQGRQATYQWLCRVYANSSAELLMMP